MGPFREYSRRAILPLVGIALALYYLFVFLPLSKRAAALDEPLQKAWRKLSLALDQTNSAGIDFLYITNQLNETRQALALLEEAKKKAGARMELNPQLRARLAAPFQLVDFESERSRQRDELEKAAQQQKITLDPGVLAGFPEHTVDIKDPALLWAALAFTQDLLDAAVRCKVTSIQSLEVPMTLTNSPDTEAATRWTRIPLQIEFTAPADNALRLIQSLPLRADDLKASGSPASNPQKMPLLVERLIIKKQSPEKLDETHVWLRAVGFVYRE